MADEKEAFGAATAITIGVASLAATSARESATVDNTTNKYEDALVQVKLKTGGTTPSNDQCAYIYAWGVIDGTTPTYPDTVTGSDAAITLNSPTQLRLIGVLNMPASSTTYVTEPLSVAQAFGGWLPAKWGIVIQNSSSALDATSGNHAVTYSGAYRTVA
jgi:hypothetical protein